MSVQEIIVYRSPADKMMWDTLSSGVSFPYMVGVIAFILLIMCGQSIIDKVRVHHMYRDYAMYVNFFVSGLITYTLIKWM